MSAWVMAGIVAGLLLAAVGVVAVIDWVYMWHTKREFLRRLVAIARQHQLDHSKYLDG